MTIHQKQHLLAYLGYNLGEVDGSWGPRSKAATWNFQEDFGGIAVDGIVGPETEKALKHAVAFGMPENDTADTGAGSTETGADKPAETPVADWWANIKHWTRAEFACRCGEYHDPYCNGFPVEPDRTLVEFLDDLEELLGADHVRSSGIRCRQHNIDSKGVTNSRHLRGKAMDVRFIGYTAKQVVNYINSLKDPRVRYTYAIDGSYVHVDVY